MRASHDTQPINRERRAGLRLTLLRSQRESFASSLMTGAYDQYINAFAIFLGATAIQIGWLNAAPQLLGALMQIGAIWLGQWFKRHRLIVTGAAIQCLGIALLVLVALPAWLRTPLLWFLIGVVLYQLGSNIVQPHWRAMMGELVPSQLRGRFFGQRSRIAMLTSLSTFLLGGLLLTVSAYFEQDGIGFLLLFLVALSGRIASTRLLHAMEDRPNTHTLSLRAPSLFIRQLRQFWAEEEFRRFALFIALMQGCVAISGPFFSVYMFRDLGFSYLAFTLNTAASILTQFLMLPLWGRICDRKGNRYVMAISASLIPLLPALWLFSDNHGYLIGIQVLSGFAWSGFNLASANYLYDLRPKHSHFSSYAAILAAATALAVGTGSLLGGYLIDWLPTEVTLSGLLLRIERPIALIFLLSTALRLIVALWYLPKAPELRVKQRGRVRDLALRIARFTPISGVILDVVTRNRQRP